MVMTIPTENIGSIPRPQKLVDAYLRFKRGQLDRASLEEIALEATRETIQRLEETGSPCVSDGEQSKFDGFASYCLHGATNLAPDGVEIVFSDGHSRFLPRLTRGPFRYQQGADRFLEISRKLAQVPVKQAVISPSVISLLYPQGGIENYSRGQFIKDILSEHAAEIERCLSLGAHKVQIDFTEGRLSLKLDPSGELLQGMVDLINQGLSGFTDVQRQRLGVHTCPGSDRDATHSADVDYKDLLPTLFRINVANFYIAMAHEKDPEKGLRIIKTLLRPGIRVFIGVIDPINPEVESPELVRDRVLQALRFIPLDQLGTCDDCGFSPFVDDVSTSREIAFEKIRARIIGTKMAEAVLDKS